jgi:hypothetical protein
MRNPPNAPARTSGTKTIAKTFQRTGQFAIDHRDGRLAVLSAVGSKSTIVPSDRFSCENAVIGARRCYRLPVRNSLMERPSQCFLLISPSDGRAFYAWQLIEYASHALPIPQFLLNRQSS